MTSGLTIPEAFQRLEVKPIVNGRGNYSVLGGSILSPGVWQAMEQANSFYVDLNDLLAAAGSYVADVVGSEAAFLTTGASGAIALGTAACMTGEDGERMGRIPDTTGMPGEVVIQHGHRYLYDRCFTMVGARLVEAGDAGGTTPEQLAEVISERTALVAFTSHLNGLNNTVPLPEVVRIAHERDIPVLVDSAYEVFPVEKMGTFAPVGADLFTFSAKYFGGPNSVGFLCGRKDLIRAAAMQGSVGYEQRPYQSFFRPFKLDRHLIFAAVTALQEWLVTDHQERWCEFGRRIERIRATLADVPGLTLTPMYFTMEDTLEPAPINCLHIAVGPEALRGAPEVNQSLRASNPAIYLHAYDDALVVVADAMREGDDTIIAERLKREFTYAE